MAYVPIIPADLAFAADGTPRSDAYDDVYHAAAGALEQASHVFLAGNDLPRAWRGRHRFVILETGFGLGLNFLAAWRAWRDDPQRCERLHFVSVERHPVRPDDLIRLHQRWPELAELSAAMLRDWPPAVPGLHRLHFDQGAVTLTLALGDAAQLLPNLAVTADALFLDGFSPAKNPELWSARIAHALAGLSRPGTTLATWTVAASVRDNLSRAGFVLDRRDGFASKRDMLVGRLPGESPPTMATGRRIAVIGAGAAGSSAAQRLAARGHQVTVFDAADEAGAAASGNKAGVFRPQPSLDDDRLARLLRACFLYGRRHVAALDGARYGLTGVLQLARDERHEDVQRRVAAAQNEAPELLRYVDQTEATRLAGWPVASGGWWFARAGWINPPSLCRANLAGLDVRYGRRIERIERQNGLWLLLDVEGHCLMEADVVVLANGIDTPRLAPAIPIRIARGLVSHLPEAAVPRFDVVATRRGYVTPAVDGIHCAGATHQVDDLDAAPRLSDHAENLQRLEAILPGYGSGLAAEQLAGRVGFRPMSPDRLPMVGRLAEEGLWLINGFGSRGLVWASLCAEILSSLVDDEPVPVERDLMNALDPMRFAAGHRPGPWSAPSGARHPQES